MKVKASPSSHPPRRIVVTGLAASYTFGGVFWDYLQYAMGFTRLGHDVLYLEDTGQWCYSPTAHTFVEDGAANAAYLHAALRTHAPELANRWFFRDAAGNEFGWDWPRVKAFCERADLFLHISATCELRDEYLRAGRVAFIDSDPMYTQAGMLKGKGSGGDDAGATWWTDRHDVFFTFGLAVGSDASDVPTAGIAWQPTVQPVVLDAFVDAARPVAQRRRVMTTVASWEPAKEPPTFDGRPLRGKSTQFLRFVDLPRRVEVPLELALSGPAPRERLESAGWSVRDAGGVSADPAGYRGYLADSLGEFSVAKEAYAHSRSGWFSCRTACYLALGVPAVVQDTGFTAHLPTGEGLLAFTTLDEAADAIARLCREPDRHAAAARELAATRFDARLVLGELLDHAMA